MIIAKRTKWWLAGPGLMAISCSFLLSCTPPGEKGGVRIPVPKDTSALADIRHFIPAEEIRSFRESFEARRDSLSKVLPGLYFPRSETFNKQALIDLLKDTTNVGIRIYYGVKTGGQRDEIRMILVGVNSQGQDLYFANGGQSGKIAAQLPPDRTAGGLEYGQCDPPCLP